jgi:hypothetical protein
MLHVLSCESPASVSALVRLSTDALQISRPTPFPLRDAVGRVLLQPGTLLVDDARTRALLERGLWVDPDDADDPSAHVQGLRTALSHRRVADRTDHQGDPLYWRALCRSTAELLKAPREPQFLSHLAELHDELLSQLDQQRDVTLLALSHGVTARDADATDASTDGATPERSAGHALLCAALATLVARRIPALSPNGCRAATLAALTMNLSITDLHETLAGQAHPLTVEQRQRLAGHARQSARLLETLGVIDADWVQAVAHHHDATCGPLAPRRPGQILGRVLQRVDLYVSLLGPEAGRPAQSPAEAVHAAYHAEDGLPDEAGMLLVRVLGVHPPGCTVRLVNGDLAVVLRCGRQVQWPVVASIANSEGLVPATPVLRTPGDPEFAIVEALPPGQAWRVPSLAQLLPLTA